jgi:predicted RNase H-like HicB family nuclease
LGFISLNDENPGCAGEPATWALELNAFGVHSIKGRSRCNIELVSPKICWLSAMKVHRYAIVIEKAESNYSAYVPDLPGCVATGATVEETESLLREAIDLHLEGMREDGLPIPEPVSVVEYLEAPV